MKRSFSTGPLAGTGPLACLIAVAVSSLFGIGRAQTAVALGTDYLTTAPGTQFLTPFGMVSLLGVPINQNLYGQTDTIVERQEDADLTSPMPIPIQLMALSLQSTAPLQINGVACNVLVGLDKANLENDKGTMTIMASTDGAGPDVFTGGTFDSILNVYYEAKFVSATGTGGCPKPIKAVTNLAQSGATWQTTPVPGAVIVPAPATCVPTVPPTVGHCLSTADQKANQHTKLPKKKIEFHVKDTDGHHAPSHSHLVCESVTVPHPVPCTP